MPEISSPQNTAIAYTPPAPKLAPVALQQKNVRIHEHRTSIRLEPAMWNALNEIAALEGRTVHDLCSSVHDLKERGASFTASLRVFMMEYYRSAMMTYRQATPAVESASA
ncbi:MAG: ribbon-helix-helix domain-containing protein [Alphaproteobacteria bacterium]|nr:ribbon-helix-helix domain-containing protein [Alphaproteobacteria bacterium]